MRLVSALPAAPPRGTRPRDRRDRLLRTAGQLFAERGYSAVSMAEIADAQGVRPSALYRHAAGKPALLLEAAEAGLRPLLEAARGAPEPLDRWLEGLAGAACAERWGARWWGPAPPHLAPPARDRVEALVAAVLAAVADGIGQTAALDQAGARVRARAVTMLLASVSFHDLRLPYGRLEALLARIAGRIISGSAAGSGTAADDRPLTAAVPGEAPTRGDRRGEILARAVELFAERGYAGVTVEQIASAAGIATGSFYNCFVGKHDLLADAFAQAEALLEIEIGRAVGGLADPARVLDRLLDQYVQMVRTRPELTTILFNDIFELDGPNRLAASRIYERLVDRWAAQVELAASCGPVEARVRTQAVFVMVHGLTLWPPGHRQLVPDDLVRGLAATAIQPA